MADTDGVTAAPGMLESMGLNVVEFGILIAFWVALFIGSSMISTETILGTTH